MASTCFRATRPLFFDNVAQVKGRRFDFAVVHSQNDSDCFCACGCVCVLHFLRHVQEEDKRAAAANRERELRIKQELQEMPQACRGTDLRPHFASACCRQADPFDSSDLELMEEARMARSQDPLHFCISLPR